MYPIILTSVLRKPQIVRVAHHAAQASNLKDGTARAEQTKVINAAFSRVGSQLKPVESSPVFTELLKHTKQKYNDEYAAGELRNHLQIVHSSSILLQPSEMFAPPVMLEHKVMLTPQIVSAIVQLITHIC